MHTLSHRILVSKINTIKLPKDVNAYNIETIELSSNLFTQFPIELLRIKNINSIRLNDNPISSIPKFTKSDYQITNISLERNNLTQFPNQFSTIKNLEYLNLDRNKIKGTVYISDFKDLTRLFLNHQFVDSLIIAPEAIPKLTHLICVYNKISHFEIEGNIKQVIRFLSLADNKLTDFSADILKLKDLETCYLQYNDISTFDISNENDHQNLKELSLAHNKLKDLIGIEKLVQLKELDLTGNFLTTFPFDALKSKKLKRLDIAYNKINTAVNHEALKTDSLEELNLRGNEFVIFPKDLLGLGNINHLNLSDNRISTKVDIQNTKVIELDLSENNISTVHISGKNKIKKLLLTSNNLTKLSFEKGAVQYLETLVLNHNSSLTTFPVEIFEEAPNLKSVSIIGCPNISQKTMNDIVVFATQNGVEYIK